MLCHQWQCHQQCGEELARHVAPHLDWCVQLQSRRSDAQGWKAFRAQVIDGAAQWSQSIHQVSNRPLMHARHAAEFKIATQHRQRGGQRTHGGSGIAQKQLRRPVGQHAPEAGNTHRVGYFGDGAAQCAQRLEHDLGVIGIEQVVHGGRALRHGCQQQNAVGNALGARQDDRAKSALQSRNVQKRSGKHYRLSLDVMVQLARVSLACSSKPSSASEFPLEIISSMACRLR